MAYEACTGIYIDLGSAAGRLASKQLLTGSQFSRDISSPIAHNGNSSKHVKTRTFRPKQFFSKSTSVETASIGLEASILL